RVRGSEGLGESRVAHAAQRRAGLRAHARAHATRTGLARRIREDVRAEALTVSDEVGLQRDGRVAIVTIERPSDQNRLPCDAGPGAHRRRPRQGRRDGGRRAHQRRLAVLLDAHPRSHGPANVADGEHLQGELDAGGEVRGTHGWFVRPFYSVAEFEARWTFEGYPLSR